MCDQKLNQANEQKTRTKKTENDVTHAIQLKLHKQKSYLK